MKECIAQDLYYKLTNNKIKLKNPYSKLSYNKYKSRILAGLYLVITNKATLLYYLKTRRDYTIKFKDLTFDLDFYIDV